ncbi:MAG: general secretion pathway protein GspD [Opitutaceae bacterium]|nr:general secretion pathway protein GspD [Cytophagales bacterium]
MLGSEQDRFLILEKKLRRLSKNEVPGLKDVVDFSVSGVSIQEFLRGLAESNNLNISVDPSLSIRIVNNFTNERVLNILIFLCKEYDLDIRFVGSIMSFYKFTPLPTPFVIPPPKEISITYNSYSDKLHLDLKGDSLYKVAKKITQVSKKNVVLANGIDFRVIGVYIEDMPFESALDKMAYSNKLRVVKTADNFYLLEPLEENGVAQSNNQGRNKNKQLTQIPNSYTNNSSGNVNGQGAGNYDFEVEYDSIANKQYISIDADNAPISDIIKDVSKETHLNYFMFSEPKGNTTLNVKKLSYDEVLSILLQGTEHTYKKTNDIFLIGDRMLEGLRNTSVMQLQNRSAEIILENIPGDLKKGVDIKLFKELNSLIMSGSNPQINDIISFVKQVDKVVPVIHIEVLLVNVNRTHTVKTGISAGLDSSKRTGGSLFPGFDFTFGSASVNTLLSQMGTGNVFNLGKVTPNFYVSLSALEQNGNINVQSTPKLSTLNSHEASLKIGSKRYYELATQNTLGSLTPTITRTVQYNQVEANLSIKITPTVSGDEQITLDIEVEVSDFTDIPPQGPPPTNTSAFKSMIRVRNEEMVVLGGLERLEKRDQGSGVPLLSRIPVIKWVFSSRVRTRTKTKQLVFIRPTIIY